MIEKIIIGLTVTITGALLVYLFRIRQLYVVIPRLFSVSNLLDNSKLIEIRVFNKSKISEEDVIILLNSEIKCELVGSTCESLSVNRNKINIPRIAPGDDYSALLLVEEGELTKQKISSITSKSTKGKVLSKLEEVPPNFGNMILGIFALVLVVATPMVSMDYYFDYKQENEKKEKQKSLDELSELAEKGWSNYDTYAFSNLRKNYSNAEFPIYQLDVKRKNNIVLISFRFINKSASEMQIIKSLDSPFKDLDPKPWEQYSDYSTTIMPFDKKDLQIPIYWPKGKQGNIVITFMISANGELYLNAIKTIEIKI